jgi:hypothetical protein
VLQAKYEIKYCVNAKKKTSNCEMFVVPYVPRKAWTVDRCRNLNNVCIVAVGRTGV